MAEQVFPPNRKRGAIKRGGPVSDNEQARRQSEAAKRTLAAQGKTEIDPTLINSELTSSGHAGRHPSEPVKPRGQTARKTDVARRSGVRPGDVHTAPINPGDNPDGPTDSVVTDPPEAGPMGGAQPTLNHAEAAAQAASKARGKKRGRKAAARKAAAKKAARAE